MDLEKLRTFCLSLPHATEDIQWQKDLLFRIGNKMFCVANTEPPHEFSFKCTPEEFAELTEKPGIIPAPYVARYHWVLVTKDDALRWKEIERLVRDSYTMVKDKLPAKIKNSLGAPAKKKK